MSVLALARDLGSTRHGVLHVLGQHLEVVWGALVAFVVVVLLTPAVGGMARLLGAVDAPGGRRLNLRPVPRLGGLDGLAAGVAAIAGLTFAVIALSLGKPDAAIMSAIVFGACIGFLRHNFYPARIFMGDSGALLLGFVLAALSVQGLLKTAATVALFFPLLVLAVPIVDTTFVVARRLKHRESPFEADQAHLHHRFLRRGFSEPRAAVTIWLWCLSLAGGALATRFIPFRAGGVWHLWPTVAAAAIGLVALAFSIYVVYVLEIVKVRNPYQRRRPPEDPLRKSA